MGDGWGSGDGRGGSGGGGEYGGAAIAPAGVIVIGALSNSGRRSGSVMRAVIFRRMFSIVVIPFSASRSLKKDRLLSAMVFGSNDLPKIPIIVTSFTDKSLCEINIVLLVLFSIDILNLVLIPSYSMPI